MLKQRSKEDVEEIVKKSHSIAEMCRNFGVKPIGGNYRVMHHLIDKYNIDTSHFTGKGWNIGMKFKPKTSKPIREILVENSYYQSHKLKLRLLKNNMKEYKCESCGNTEWLGFPIPLELHHINGNHFDNRLENLKILCPTCHAMHHKYKKDELYNVENNDVSVLEKEINCENIKSNVIKQQKSKVEKPKRYCLICGNELDRKQTKYCSYECAKKASCKRPSYDELLNIMVENEYNLTKVGRLFGVSANAIKKWCKHYNITNGSSSFVHKKKIAQYSEDDELIEIYESIADAILKTNISTIQKSLQDNSKTAGGFIWRYVEE